MSFTGWFSSSDRQIAAQEGWDMDMFRGQWRVVRRGMLALAYLRVEMAFGSDEEATLYVAARAAEGSDLHKRAWALVTGSYEK